MKNQFNKFSVPLGLVDYINPILYTITITTIINNNISSIESPYNTFLLIGVILSIVFGFLIPTGKVLVGLNIIEFKMPVSLVLCVNSGIFLSGVVLLKYAFSIKTLLFILLVIFLLAILTIIYMLNKNINTLAVLIGAFGYLMTYISLIIMSHNNHMILPIALYIIAIVLFVMLCGIGIKANLKNPKVHWIIEISNILYQLLVTIGTIVLFKS